MPTDPENTAPCQSGLGGRGETGAAPERCPGRGMPLPSGRRGKGDLAQRNADLKALDAAGRALGSSLDLRAALERALTLLLGKLRYRAFDVLLVDWETCEIEIYSGRHARRSRPTFQRVDLQKLPAHGAVTLDAVAACDGSRSASQPGRLLASPITGNGRALGFLAASLPARRRSIRRERSLLGRIGRRIGAAVVNARLYEQARREADRLAAVNLVGSAVRRSLRVPSLLDEALRQLLAVTNLEFGVVFLAGKETSHLSAAARAGMSDELAAALGEEVERELKLREPSPGNRKPIAYEDLPGRREGWRKPPRCLMHIPLCSLAHTFGVLSVGSASQRHFAPAATDFMRTMGGQISLALENAHLYEETEEYARRLAAINAELSRANEALREAMQSKDQFLANVSHELKRPLAPARLAVETLLEAPRGKVAPQRQERLLRNALSNLDNMDALVSQLLDAVRLQRQPQPSTDEITDLRSVVRRSLAAMRPLAEARGIQVQSIISSRAIKVAGDAEALGRVCTNLLSNAVKFNREGGSVLVQLEESAAGEAVLSVTDTGVGIPAHARRHIFDPFYQADASSTRAHDGLGLGLYIAKGIVEQHGGQIRFDTEEGAGTTFTVALPRV
jgi:signal transduction histidine kinase